MKKTWTTKILIALLTLAMVVGVVAIAPKAAQAAPSFSISGPTTPVEVGQTATVTVAPTEGSAYYYVFYNGTTVLQADVFNYYSFQPTASGPITITCDVFADSTKTNKLNNNVLSYTITVNAASVKPSITALNVPAGNVNKPDYTATFQVSGSPMPSSVTVTGLDGTGLRLDSYSSTSGIATISGTPTKTGTFTANISATNSAGTSDAFNQPILINQAAVTLSLSDTSVAKGSTVTLRVTGGPDTNDYEWSKAGTVDTTQTGPTYPFTGGDDASVAFSVRFKGNTDYAASTTPATCNVSVTPAAANVSITSPGNGASYATNSTIYLRGTTNAADCLWSVSANATNLVQNADNILGASYQVSNDDVGKTLTFTLTSPTTTGAMTKVTKTVTVSIYSNDVVTTPASNYTMSFNTATLYDVQNFTATTSHSGDMKISNSNPAIAQVTAVDKDGRTQTVTAAGLIIPNGSLVSVKALAYGRTYIDVVPANGSSSNGRRITAYVGSQTPTLDVQFWSCDYCTTTLTKVNNWGTLKVTVDNYNPAYPYVTITRSNIRTYVQGGSYYSHPSTYTYTAALTQDLSDPLKATATLYVIPQYNGTTHYTAAYTGAVSKNSPTIYVTGYTTLPQTGPNYTWAYVLGGLCLATMAAAVTLNVRKKKRENI